jgi:hypothetical protein
MAIRAALAVPLSLREKVGMIAVPLSFRERVGVRGTHRRLGDSPAVTRPALARSRGTRDAVRGSCV